MIVGINAEYLARPATGLGVYLDQILSALAKIDKKNTYYLYAPFGIELPNHYGKNFIFKYCPVKPKKEFLNQFVKTKIFTDNPPDILSLQHCRIPSPKSTKNILITLTVHDILPVVFLTKKLFSCLEWLKTLSPKSLLSPLLYQRALRRVDQIFTISETTTQDIAKYFKKIKTPILCAPNGLDQLFSQAPPLSQVKLCLEKQGIGKNYLICYSGLSARKNISRLVSAWLELPLKTRQDNYLVITGGGWKKRSLEKQLAKIPDHGIRLPGNLPRHTLYLLVAGARASCYLSHYEGFGLPIIESLALGVPVIASRIPSTLELVGEQAHYVDPLSREKITQALGLAIKGEIPKPQSAQIKEIIKKYRWDVTAKKILSAWTELFTTRTREIRSG